MTEQEGAEMNQQRAVYYRNLIRLRREKRELLKRLEVAEKHYEAHKGCDGIGCTCFEFVRAWEATFAKEGVTE